MLTGIEGCFRVAFRVESPAQADIIGNERGVECNGLTDLIYGIVIAPRPVQDNAEITIDLTRERVEFLRPPPAVRRSLARRRLARPDKHPASERRSRGRAHSPDPLDILVTLLPTST